MYDFDTLVDRSGTDSSKLYLHPESRYETIIPMWIADMDFETAPAVKKAIMARASHGIYGYTVNHSDYYAAVCSWMQERHGMKIDSKWITITPGVVAALKNACAAFLKPGDAVLIQPPVYHFFYHAPQANGCRVVENPLVLENGVYRIDFERKIVEQNVKMFILCNPHNPTGNLWTRDELQKMGSICKKHGVLVVDDEIHNDFVFHSASHTPFLSVDPSFEEFTVFCTAPSKTFNLAGIKSSNILIPNEALRKRFDQIKNAHGLGGSNVFGGKAVIAAYTQGASWVDELVDYIEGNFQALNDCLRDRLPMLHLINHNSLYLAWVDCRAWGLSDEELKRFFEYDCGILPSMGAEFRTGGSGFVRLNLACPRSVVNEALSRIVREAERCGLIPENGACRACGV